VLSRGSELLRAGISVIIFPQTTRSVTFDPVQFNSIGTKLARKAGVPMVPVALKTDALANGKIFRDFGKVDPSKAVRFAFGEPMRVADRGAEEHARTMEFIQGKLRQWEKEEASG
jgi:1-acyl-sn-glycerol-3-phosphate acyltransferase